MARFERESARRIVEATRYIEKRPRNAVDRAAGGREIPYSKVGKLTTGLSARSGTTPGSGTVQPYLITPTSMAASGSTQPIFNWTGSTAAMGKLIKYTVIDGHLWYDGNDCSTVAVP